MSLIRKLTAHQPIHGDAGLLLIRVGIGLIMLLFHGHGKITGGVDLWERLGGSMENLGISSVPRFWGFMAALSEFGGSLLLILGILFRPAAALLALTMLVAATHHLSIPAGEPGAGWKGASHAIELLCVYVGLLLAGAGKYTLPALWTRNRTTVEQGDP